MFVAAVTVTTHVRLFPVQPPPLQPAKEEIPSAAAVNVTSVFCGYVAEQPVVAPDAQLIPAGLLDTFPVPVPAITTLMPYPGLKFAVTLVAAVTVMLHVGPSPEQPPPLQPANE
jgi:hypothetical protein